jgi:molybdenum cofactor cytidylyltransferase
MLDDGERAHDSAAQRSNPVKLAGVILAGGSSRRMGAPKAALLHHGQSFARRVLEALASAELEPIVIVAGEHREALTRALPPQARVEIVTNPQPERGQLSSLKIALEHLRAHAPGASGAVVGLIDHPAVAPRTVATLACAARAAVVKQSEGAASEPSILVPCNAGKRGHPVVFLRRVWDELLATPDEAGARQVVRRDPARVREVVVDDPGILLDVDTPQDLRALNEGDPPARAG